MRTLVCRNCGRQIVRNKKLRHLDQHYCGAKACQAARKLSFERHKYKTDPIYRSEKLQSARQRRKKQADQGNPLASSQYQHEYRASHPVYVSENRLKQRLRNTRKADKTALKEKIVNPDTFMLQKPDNDRVYAMIALDYKKIVNPDTFVKECIDMEQIAKVKPMLVRLL